MIHVNIIIAPHPFSVVVRPPYRTILSFHNNNNCPSFFFFILVLVPWALGPTYFSPSTTRTSHSFHQRLSCILRSFLHTRTVLYSFVSKVVYKNETWRFPLGGSLDRLVAVPVAKRSWYVYVYNYNYNYSTTGVMYLFEWLMSLSFMSRRNTVVSTRK